MSTPTPAVGRVVHYVARGSADGVFLPACRAAMITETQQCHAVQHDGGEHDETLVGLVVLNPTGMYFHPIGESTGCDEDQGHPPIADLNERGLCDHLAHKPGSWHWPARA